MTSMRLPSPSLVIRTRVVDRRQVPARELDVDDRSDDLDDLADFAVCCDCHVLYAFLGLKAQGSRLKAISCLKRQR